VTDSGSHKIKNRSNIILSFWKTEPFSIWRQHRICTRAGGQALTATRLWTKGRGSICGSVKDFSLCHSVQAQFGANQVSYPMEIGSLFRGGKKNRPNVRVKHAWSYTFTPTYVFMARCLITHSENFAFTFNVILFLKFSSYENHCLFFLFLR
jgi:hypothetical protein